MTPKAKRSDFDEAVRLLQLSLGRVPGVFEGSITVHLAKGKDPKPDVRDLNVFEHNEAVATGRREA